MPLLPFEVEQINNPFRPEVLDQLGINGSLVDRLREERQLFDTAMGAADKGGDHITKPQTKYKMVDTGFTPLKSGGTSEEFSGPVTKIKPKDTPADQPKKDKPKT